MQRQLESPDRPQSKNEMPHDFRSIPDRSLPNRARRATPSEFPRVSPATHSRTHREEQRKLLNLLEHRAGIEPANTGFADQRVSHFATGALGVSALMIADTQ